MTNCGPFAGIPDAQLFAYLASAQKAYVDLSMGAGIASATYTQGDGAKSVSYSSSNIGQLLMLIRQLKQALGIETRTRRGIRPVFSR